MNDYSRLHDSLCLWARCDATAHYENAERENLTACMFFTIDLKQLSGTAWLDGGAH